MSNAKHNQDLPFEDEITINKACVNGKNYRVVFTSGAIIDVMNVCLRKDTVNGVVVYYFVRGNELAGKLFNSSRIDAIYITQ